MKHRGPNGMHVPPSGSVPLGGRPAAADTHDAAPDEHKLGDYRDRVDALPDVREEKVDDLRDAVESGSYYVESEKIAKKVVDESIREAVQRERPTGR